MILPTIILPFFRVTFIGNWALKRRQNYLARRLTTRHGHNGHAPAPVRKHLVRRQKPKSLQQIAFYPTVSALCRSWTKSNH